MGTAPRRDHGIAVPVRTFRLGSTRLAEGLDPGTRAELARRCATRVVHAAAGAPVVVVSSAPEVVAWAATVDAVVVPDPGSLDEAARCGVAELARLGCIRAVVAHADLPLVTSFAAVAHDAGRPTAVLVPCHRGDGTPVLSLPTVATDFGFAYGSGSFRRHVAATRAAGLAVRVVRDPALAFDVDTVDDVDTLARRDPTLLGARVAPAATAR